MSNDVMREHKLREIIAALILEAEETGITQVTRKVAIDAISTPYRIPSSAPAQSEAKPPFRFNRYVSGELKAEGVCIEKAKTLEHAIKKAIRICPKASGVTTLVYVSPPALNAPSVAPARPVTSRDDIERAIAFHHLEMLANGPVVAMQKTLSEFSAARAQSVAWTERWHGSTPERGWSIYAGRDCIAYIGGDEGMSEAISKIVAAHNKCFDCDGGPCVMNCSGRASRISDATKGGEANPEAPRAVPTQSEAKPVEFKYPDFTEWWYTQDVIDEDEPSARGLARRIFNDARAIDPRPSAPATHTHRFAIDPSSDEPRCVVCGCEPESVPAENGGDAEIKKLVERIKGGAELSEGGWSGTVKTCDAILEILSKRGGA